MVIKRKVFRVREAKEAHSRNHHQVRQRAPEPTFGNGKVLNDAPFESLLYTVESAKSARPAQTKLQFSWEEHQIRYILGCSVLKMMMSSTLGRCAATWFARFCDLPVCDAQAGRDQGNCHSQVGPFAQPGHARRAWHRPPSLPIIVKEAVRSSPRLEKPGSERWSKGTCSEKGRFV